MNINEPAFPCQVIEGQAYNQGITKREYFAAMAMQGVLAAGNVVLIRDVPVNDIVEKSIQIADELLKQLES